MAKIVTISVRCQLPAAVARLATAEETVHESVELALHLVERVGRATLNSGRECHDEFLHVRG